jgi:hypothetical protein
MDMNDKIWPYVEKDIANIKCKVSFYYVASKTGLYKPSLYSDATWTNLFDNVLGFNFDRCFISNTATPTHMSKHSDVYLFGSRRVRRYELIWSATEPYID